MGRIILIAAVLGTGVFATWASYSGWGIGKPAWERKSVRHGSRRVRRRPYYFFYGRTHSRYHGK
jgi:hypothetical protein